jgi:hypothetical protein
MVKRIWGEIRRGENIDLYLTVAVALVFTVLNVLGLAPSDKISALTLAILALLTISMLISRHKVEEAVQQMAQPGETQFLEKFPIGFDEDLQKCHTILIIGVSLSRTVKTYFELLQKKIKRGDHIRILMVSPVGNAAELTEMRTYGRSDVERLRFQLRASLADLCELSQNSTGLLEVRVIDYPIGFGGFGIDLDTHEGILYLEHYPFRTPGGSLPKFILRSRDGRWYEQYKLEMTMLWESGKTWDCTT